MPVPRKVIPWESRTSAILRLREMVHPFRDPLSCGYIAVEDRHRSIRFERECPNPVWWFGYTKQERGPEGSGITWTNAPDVEVLRSGRREDGAARTQTPTMRTAANFDGYAIAPWGLPVPRATQRPVVETTGKEATLACNRAGAWHRALLFDLRPGAEVGVTVREGP